MTHVLFVALFLSNQPVPDSKAEEAALRALKDQARAATKSSGCLKASDCKVLPMGSRACGGPSEFLVYCATTSDAAKLKQHAKAVTDAETAYNGRHGVASICAVLTPPPVSLKAGVCELEAPRPTDVPM